MLESLRPYIVVKLTSGINKAWRQKSEEKTTAAVDALDALEIEAKELRESLAKKTVEADTMTQSYELTRDDLDSTKKELSVGMMMCNNRLL